MYFPETQNLTEEQNIHGEMLAGSTIQQAWVLVHYPAPYIFTSGMKIIILKVGMYMRSGMY